MTPEMTGIAWIDWLLVIAAALGAVGVIWRKAIRPIVKAARVLDQVLPTLIDIGKQFHENGGSTLKDSLNRIEEQLGANSQKVSTVVDVQAEQGAVQAEQGAKLDALHTYAHEARHEQGSQIAGLAAFDEGITRKLDDLAAHLEPVPGKLDAIAVAAGAADDAAVEHREAHPDHPGE